MWLYHSGCHCCQVVTLHLSILGCFGEFLPTPTIQISAMSGYLDQCACFAGISVGCLRKYLKPQDWLLESWLLITID